MTDARVPDTAAATDGLDLNGVAQAIERILASDGTGPAVLRRRQAAGDGPAETDGAAATADDRQDAATADDTDGGDAGDGEGEAGDDDQPRYTVKVDGEAQEVTLDELMHGYQRNADYTRKTMKVAEERRELMELRREAEHERALAEAERRSYTTELDQAIPMLREQLNQHFGGIDWQQLAAEEPVRFAELAPAFELLSGQLQQAEAMRHRLRQQQRQQDLELQQARLRHRNEEWRALVRHLPELGEPAAARREVQAMTSYLLEAGYEREELDRLVDHRDFILARKAMLYDRMAGSKDRIERQVRGLPKVQRPGAAPQRSDRGREHQAALMNRLRRTGSTEDAARAIEGLL